MSADPPFLLAQLRHDKEQRPFLHPCPTRPFQKAMT